MTNETLFKTLGCDRDERVLLGWLPFAPEITEFEDGPVTVAVAHAPGSGPDQGVVLDVEDNGDDTRFWKTMNFARANGMNHVPLIYDGAAETAHIPEYLESAGGYFMARRYTGGAWWCVLDKSPCSSEVYAIKVAAGDTPTKEAYESCEE